MKGLKFPYINIKKVGSKNFPPNGLKSRETKNDTAEISQSLAGFIKGRFKMLGCTPFGYHSCRGFFSIWSAL